MKLGLNCGLLLLLSACTAATRPAAQPFTLRALTYNIHAGATSTSRASGCTPKCAHPRARCSC